MTSRWSLRRFLVTRPPTCDHGKAVTDERSDAQRAASARNAEMARAAAGLRRAERAAAKAAASEAAYGPVRAAIAAALTANSAAAAAECCRRGLLELAKVGATPDFDPSRSRAIGQALREAARLAREDFPDPQPGPAGALTTRGQP